MHLCYRTVNLSYRTVDMKSRGLNTRWPLHSLPRYYDYSKPTAARQRIDRMNATTNGELAGHIPHKNHVLYHRYCARLLAAAAHLRYYLPPR